MSHFSVAVITKKEPTNDVLLAALEPYEEFECTGRETRFIQEVDQTDEMLRDYERHTSPKLRDADGILHDPYEDRFYRDPSAEELEKHKPMIGTGGGGGISWTSKDWGDGKGHRAKVRFIPDGMTEVRLPDKETKTFAEFIKDWSGKTVVPFGKKPDIKGKHKYGYVLTDKDGNVIKVIDRTNPNKKWDWYSVGGRYRGQLMAKPGVFKNKAWRDGDLDSLKVGDIDFARMRATTEIERRSAIDKAILAIQAKSPDLTRERIYAIHAASALAFPKAKAAWEAEGKTGGGGIGKIMESDSDSAEGAGFKLVLLLALVAVFVALGLGVLFTLLTFRWARNHALAPAVQPARARTA